MAEHTGAKKQRGAWSRGVMIVALMASLLAPAWLSAGIHIRVRQGDTLATIGKRYGLTAADIARANRLKTNSRLVAGAMIYIPVKTSGATSSAVVAKQPTTSEPSPTINVNRATRIRVQKGDSLWKIAQIAGVSVETLARANGLSADDDLTAGQLLIVPARGSNVPTRVERVPATTTKSSARPAYVTVERGDSLWKIANEYGMSASQLAKINGLSSNATLNIGQRLTLLDTGSSPERDSSPSSPPPQAPPASVPTGSSGAVSRFGFSWPLKGKVVRTYEQSDTTKHFGLDIEVSQGTQVMAARDGVVVYAGDGISAYGKMVIIEHDGDYATCYAFNQRIMVSVGQSVKRGAVIALSGNSPKYQSPTIHFQLRRGGSAIDPSPYLP